MELRLLQGGKHKITLQNKTTSRFDKTQDSGRIRVNAPARRDVAGLLGGESKTKPTNER